METKAIIFDWIGNLYDRDKGLFPFSKKVLEALKPKYKLGLVSIAKQGIDKRKRQINESGILYLFDSVIIDIVKTAEQYQKCMEELETSPEITAIVDDRASRGIKAGNQLGCVTYWIDDGEYANEKPNEETGEPDHTIKSVEDLLNLL